MEKRPCVYILTNAHHTVLYVGVTSNLGRRMREHLEGAGSRFVRQNRVHKLVFVQHFPSMVDAIQAEKRLKSGSRLKKIEMIEEMNAEWRDLLGACEECEE